MLGFFDLLANFVTQHLAPAIFIGIVVPSLAFLFSPINNSDAEKAFKSFPYLIPFAFLPLGLTVSSLFYYIATRNASTPKTELALTALLCCLGFIFFATVGLFIAFSISKFRLSRNSNVSNDADH